MTVLIVLIALVALTCLGSLVIKWRKKPGRRLLREFKHVRKMILADIKGPNRKIAVKLLGDCGAHLKRVLKAKAQKRKLGEMATTVSQITGKHQSNESKEVFEKHITENLNDFFVSLSRISTLVSFQEDEALDSLREFAVDLETQRAELLKLSFDLQQDDPLEQEFAKLNAESVDSVPQDQTVTH